MSTVRRPAAHRAYIREVSKQTRILLFQGFLFFGTIVHVEDKLRSIVDNPNWRQDPVRFVGVRPYARSGCRHVVCGSVCESTKIARCQGRRVGVLWSVDKVSGWQGASKLWDIRGTTGGTLRNAE